MEGCAGWYRHSPGTHPSCMRLFSLGEFPGRQQAMHWDAVRAKQVLPRSVNSLPQLLSKFPKKPSVMCIIITKRCIKKYPSALLARRKTYLSNINANFGQIFKGFQLSLYCPFRQHQHSHGNDFCMRASKI